MTNPSFPYQVHQHRASLHNQAEIANSQTQPPSIWKLLGSTGQPTPREYSNASVIRKAMLTYFPPRLFQEGCLILSNQYMGEGSLDNLKAMPKVFSLEENSDWA